MFGFSLDFLVHSLHAFGKFGQLKRIRYRFCTSIQFTAILQREYEMKQHIQPNRLVCDIAVFLVDRPTNLVFCRRYSALFLSPLPNFVCLSYC